MPQYKLILPAALLITLASASAQATNGYFAHGYGTKSKAMAGSGVAFSQDSMAAATNPAGMVFQGRRMDIGASVFRPFRSYEAAAGGLVNGNGQTVDSDREEFLIPHFGYNHPLDEKSAIGVSVYGNGGMNTYHEYKDTPGDFGTYGGGTAGVDLMQAFITPTYSRKLSDTASYGVSAVIAYQRFKAYGLQNFSGLSNDSSNLTEKGYDDAWGIGAKIGFQAEVTPGITLGASYQSKIYSEEFDKYKGLFAEQGDFDIPATATIGLAAALNKDTVVTFDVQRIWYSDVDSIANDMLPAFTNCATRITPTSPYCLGGDKGIGFGWDDMTIYKLGIQWQSSPDWTWRAGVSHAEMPIDKSEVIFNILAPAVVEEHITFGFTHKLDKNNEINFAAMYAPEESISGNPITGQEIEIEMDQYELELSWGMTWD
ncbi:OmpP1/FadL family transporter [Pseudomonadota bacterium]